MVVWALESGVGCCMLGILHLLISEVIIIPHSYYCGVQYHTWSQARHSGLLSSQGPRDKKGWTQRVGLANVSPKGLYHGIRGWFKLDSGSLQTTVIII